MKTWNLTGLEPRALRAWLAVGGWILIVTLVAGGASLSAQSTRGFLESLLLWLSPDISPATAWRIHVAIRKSAHVVEYGVLALLTYRALRLSSPAPIIRHVALALALVCVVAAADELRQTYTYLRSGTLGDFGLDVAGGLAALCLVVFLRRSPRVLRWSPGSAADDR